MADESPKEYWKDGTLNLYFKDVKDCSLDDHGSKKYKKKATVPGNPVKDLQKDLIALGYLESGSDDGYFGRGCARAVTRFQRHAGRVYRIGQDKKPCDVSASEVFSGKADGVCNQATATEVRKWIDKKWILPCGRFQIKEKVWGTRYDEGGKLITGKIKLREDIFDAWDKVITHVHSLGGTLEGPYGDSHRVLQKMAKVGTSGYSFHYSARAVDINQDFTKTSSYGPKGKDDKIKVQRRYFIQKEDVGDKVFWRILCWAEKQDGTQGFLIDSKTKSHWGFLEGKDSYVPKGYYIDLTAEIESTGDFERIKAITGWEGNSNKAEWWHFQYAKDKQATFSDELELIGFTEKKIRESGWETDAALDHCPG